MKNYTLDQVPNWCYMSPEEHACLGGCWGISYGNVAREGESYCKGCELYIGNLADKPIVIDGDVGGGQQIG